MSDNFKSIEQTPRKVEDLGNDEWSRPRLRDVKSGAILVDINLGEGEPDWHTVTDEGEPLYRIKKGVVFEIVEAA